MSTDREVAADRPVGRGQRSDGSRALGGSAEVCHIEPSGTGSISHHLLSTDTTNTWSFTGVLHSRQSVITLKGYSSQ